MKEKWKILKERILKRQNIETKYVAKNKKILKEKFYLNIEKDKILKEKYFEKK